MDELRKIAGRAEREAWANAVGNLFRYAGAAVGLGFVCALFGFAGGFYAGGLAALLWPASVVLGLWFVAGALAYFLLRDIIFRAMRWLLNPIVVAPVGPSYEVGEPGTGPGNGDGSSASVSGRPF